MQSFDLQAFRWF